MNKREIEKDTSITAKRLMNADWAGDTILHLAVETSDLEIVKTVLKLGADVNQLNSYNETALFSENITVEIAQYLLDEKINPNIKNGCDEIAIMQHCDNIELVELLAPISEFDYQPRRPHYYYQSTPFLHRLIEYRSLPLSTIEAVLKHSKGLNILNEASETILMRAAQQRQNSDMILFLAKSGISLHQTNNRDKDFYDLCYKNVQKIIREEFPDFIKEKELRESMSKYNL